MLTKNEHDRTDAHDTGSYVNYPNYTSIMYNYRIGEVMGIPIRINISLVVFLPLLAWLLARPIQIAFYADLVQSAIGRPIDVDSLIVGDIPLMIGIVSAIALFFSVLVHELGHSYIARRYDIPIASITLWIFGGIASLERIPREWNREFWIAIAGPVASVGLAAIFLIGAWIIPATSPVVLFLVGWLAVINVILAVFNLIPAFPMDGGRILRALLARNQPYVDATRTAAGIGRLIAIFLAILGAISFNVLLILVALFVYGAATTESRMVVLDELLDGVTAGDIMASDLQTIRATDSIHSMVDRMIADRRTEYPVLDAEKTLVGSISLSDVSAVTEEEWPTTSVASIMNPSVRTVDVTLPAFEVLRILSERSTSHVVVTQTGRPVGIISPSEVGTALALLRGVGKRERPPSWIDGVR